MNAPTGTLTSEVIMTGDTATVRVDDWSATDIADLWTAVTDPDRLARWIATVQGELKPGGRFTAEFTSGWSGHGEVEACEAPNTLRVRTWDADSAPTTMIAELWADGEGTRLRVEERGLPAAVVHDHKFGWQVHIEDLGAILAGRPASNWFARWSELTGRPVDPPNATDETD